MNLNTKAVRAVAIAIITPRWSSLGNGRLGGGRTVFAKTVLVFALVSVSVIPAQPQDTETTQHQSPPTAKPSPSYILAPGDIITIRALEVEEISDKPVRIDDDGTINLPMIGRMQAGGLSVEKLEREVVTRLKPYLHQPDVAVFVNEPRSQTVSVIGAVKNPGVHEIQGGKRLVEVLSMAGGLQEDAGNSLKITRSLEWGPLPLAGSTTDSTAQFSVAKVNLNSLIGAQHPEENISVMPHDVISIPRGDMVYVIGDVKKAGGFVLKQQETLSVLQALALAEGLDRTASPKNAKILRLNTGASRRAEIPVNLKKILSAQADDMVLQPDDILFVPGSKSRAAMLETLRTAVQIGVGVSIWRR